MPSLQIDLVAKFAQFSDALDQMSRKASASAGQIDRAFGALKGTLATLGVGLSVVALKGFVQGSIDAADRLNDLSKKTGIAVETLGGLGFAAQQSGGGLDSMADAAGKLNRSIAEAAAGNQEKAEAFKVLGVSVRDATGNLKSADQVMIELADKFEGYADGPNKVALAMKLFGKAGADIIPTLDEGGAKIKANIAYYERYSGVTKETAQRADEFNDTLTKLSLISGAVGTKIASELLGPLQKMADRLLEAKENSRAFETAAEGLKVVFAALISFGSGVAFVFEAVGIKLGALAAQAVAVGRLDFKGSLTIGREAQADIDAARVSMEKYVVSLFKAKTAAELDDAEKFPQSFFGRKKPQAPGLTDTANKGRADAAAKAFADLAAMQSKIVVDVEKSAAKERLSILEHFYREGAVDEAHFWKVRGEIQRSAYDAERKALDEGVAARMAEVNRIGTDPKLGKKSADYASALKDLAVAQAARNKLESDFNAEDDADDLGKIKATKDYETAIKNVNIQLLEMQGNTAEAARARIALENNQPLSLRNQAKGRVDIEGQADITRQERAVLAQAEFNDLKTKASEITTQLGIAEDQIRNKQRAGQILELDAMRQLDDGKRSAVAQLAKIGIELDRVGQNSGIPNLRFQVLQFDSDLKSLAASADSLGDRFRGMFEDSFTDQFAKVIDGTQKMSDAFKNMARNIVSELAKIQARGIAQGISNIATGAVSGGGGLSSFFKNLLGGFFGGGGDVNSITPSASGGRRSAGQLLMVGERGPELWMPDSAGTVIPNNRFSGGDVNIYQTLNIDSRADQQSIRHGMAVATQQSVAAVEDVNRRRRR